MGTASNTTKVNFFVGELIHHRLFDYRGVIVDVDMDFQGTEQWYEAVARSKPPKNKPWYHVLVHGSNQATYVAEQNLQTDKNLDPVDHPMIEQFFSKFDNGKYIRIDSDN